MDLAALCDMASSDAIRVFFSPPCGFHHPPHLQIEGLVILAKLAG